MAATDGLGRQKSFFAEAITAAEKMEPEDPRQKKIREDNELRQKLAGELEELKVATMYNMVDTIKTSVSDSQTEIECLYMTNDQAMQVQIKNMPSVRQQLGIKDPSMVIRLMPSHFGTAYQKTFKFYSDGEGNGRFPTKAIPEVNEEDRERTDHQLLLLAKDVLLPLASKTRALVIGCESCALTAAFVQVSGQIQRQLGEDCPFRLLIFARAYFYEMSSREPMSVAYHVRQGSKGWSEETSRDRLREVLQKSYGEDECFYPMEDLPSGRYLLIMFECVQKRRLVEETFNNFTNDFITSLSETLPVIALQTYGTNKMASVPALAEHVSRGLPLMLLDSRDRGGWAANLEDAQLKLQDRLDILHAIGRTDQYFISAIAYIKGTLDNMKPSRRYSMPPPRKIGKSGLRGAADTAAAAFGDAKAMALTVSTTATVAGGDAEKGAAPADGVSEGSPNPPVFVSTASSMRSGKSRASMSLEEAYSTQRSDREMFIWEAINRRLEESSRKAGGGAEEEGIGDARSQAARARAKAEARREAVFEGTNMIMRYVGSELEWEATTLMKRGKAAIENVMAPGSWKDFKERLEDNWCAIRGVTFHSYKTAYEFVEKHSDWIELTKRGRSLKGNLVLSIVLDKNGNDGKDLDKAKKALRELFEEQLDVCEKYDRKIKTRKAFCDNQNMWISVYDLLMADPETVHTGNIFDLKHVHSKIEVLAQIDRLPQKNTLEALVLMRTAWNICDIYNASAHMYKKLARWTYFLLLLVGVGTITFTVANTIYPDVLNDQRERDVLLVLALAASGLTGFTALVDPSRKWLQLRSSAYKMESEIWKFRTRVGQYQGHATAATVHGRLEDERRAEEVLQARILQIQGHIRLSTGLKETAFYSVPMATNDLTLDKEGKAGSERRRSCWQILGVFLLAPRPPPGSKEKEARLLAQHFHHGQYRRYQMDREKSLKMGRDSFHAPARPDDYIRWRLVPKMRFYQSRIPSYFAWRRGFQALLLIAALITSLLAALKEVQWTAIVAAIASAVASAQEFLDLQRKLQRYSTVADALGNILVAWQALTEVEQANVEKVSQLVYQTESLLDEERNAWISDAQNTQYLHKSSADGGGKGQGAKGKA